MQSSILAEQGRLHFLVTEDDAFNSLDMLEDELVNWVPGSRKSPDRLDALAHAINYLNKEVIAESEEELRAKSIIKNLF